MGFFDKFDRKLTFLGDFEKKTSRIMNKNSMLRGLSDSVRLPKIGQKSLGYLPHSAFHSGSSRPLRLTVSKG